MTAQRDDILESANSRDCLDRGNLPEIAASYFDPDLHAWVLSRDVDLLAAFHDPRFIPGRRDLHDVSLDFEERARLQMREEVREALCPANVRAWREALRARSDLRCGQLPVAEPVDLVAAYARPLCLHFAAHVTGIDDNQAESLEQLAQIVSAATADPEDSALRAQAKDANAVLRSYFSAGPEPLRDSGFVGLLQTLLRIVAAAWYELIQSPDQWCLLRASPQLVDQAMEELLAQAGVIRSLWRTAAEDIDLNRVLIRKGDHVLLRVSAGSRGPERPGARENLGCPRRGGHFTFGAGGHSCVAANLIRMAAVCITAPLLVRFVSIQLVRPVEWHGGSVMRSPAILWVILNRD